MAAKIMISDIEYVTMADTGGVIVPGNGYLDVTVKYEYRNSGKATLTYTLTYHGVQIDSWTGKMDISPAPPPG